MCFKIDWTSLIVGSKFTVFALFYFVFEGNFSSTSPWPGGAYIWRGDLMEGFLHYRFRGLIHERAYFRNFTVCSLGRSCSTVLLITPFSLIIFFFRQGHAAAVVDKKVYIFGGSSGSGFGGQHSDSSSDPVYLNDLFLLKGMIETVNARNSCLLSSISVVKFKH